MLKLMMVALLLAPPYKGVTPPQPRIPEELPPPGGAQCLMVWPGFQMLKAKARLFFLFTKEPRKVRVVTVKKGRDVRPHVELRFSGCRAWENNAWRPLITHYFPTRLSAVYFGDDPKTGELVVELYFKDDALPAVGTPSRTTLKGYPLYQLFFPRIKPKAHSQ